MGHAPHRRSARTPRCQGLAKQRAADRGRGPRDPVEPERAITGSHGHVLLARRPNHIWMIDFTRVGGVIRPLWVGAVIDAYSRRVLAIGDVLGIASPHASYGDLADRLLPHRTGPDDRLRPSQDTISSLVALSSRPEQGRSRTRLAAVPGARPGRTPREPLRGGRRRPRPANHGRRGDYASGGARASNGGRVPPPDGGAGWRR